MSDPIGLQAHQLHVERGGRAVLRGVSLEVPPGTWTALVGPNGAGKSTAMAALAGVLAVRSGEVSLDGRALSAWPRTNLFSGSAVWRMKCTPGSPTPKVRRLFTMPDSATPPKFTPW